MTQMTLFDYEMAQANQAKYIRRITYEETKPFLLGIHYARRMPCITDAFGLFLDGRIAGCVTYGVPASRPLCVGLAGAESILKGLPSAQPERCEDCVNFSKTRVGKWETEIRTILGAKIPFYACSECGKNSADEYRYCPNCGARMVRGERDEQRRSD